MWRYRELLPIDGEPTVGPQVGGTPLIRAHRLAEALGVEKLWIKNDAVNFPDAFLQGPRGLRGPEQGPRVRLHHGRLCLDRQPGQQRRRQCRPGRAGNATSSSPAIWNRPRSSAPASTAPRSSASAAPTTRSIACARRSPSSTAGASSTSTCGPSTRKAPRRWASRSPSSSAGACRSTWSCRWPAAA